MRIIFPVSFYVVFNRIVVYIHIIKRREYGSIAI